MYELYEREVDLFPENNPNSSLINSQKEYNSFVAESGLINVNYTKTLFMTQKVNQKGYYRYFVKRNGEYYVSCVDDIIPVDKKTQ